MHQSYLTTLLLTGLPSVFAHSVISNVFINSVDQGDGQNKYIRSPPNTNPIKDISLPSLNCNVNGGTPAPSFISALPNDTLTFEWRRITRGDDIIDPSHSGPIITYITPFVDTQPSGSVWTKVHQEGYDSVKKKWAVDKLISQRGKWEFVLPVELKAGRYIIRQEIIALHEANARFDENPERGAQFYPGCVQVEVGGEGQRELLGEGFDLNKGYRVDDPGIFFNLYEGFEGYPIPGPAVWDGATGGSGNGSTAVAGRSAGGNEEPPLDVVRTPSGFATVRREAKPTPV